MTDEERVKFLLSMLISAVIIHTHDRKEDHDNVPGLMGAPPLKGEEGEEKEDEDEPTGVTILNKVTDMLTRCIEVAGRYEIARELDMLIEEQSPEDMVEKTPIGIAFSMKIKKTVTTDQTRAMELGASLAQSYFHYRIFEEKPTVSEFIEAIDWNRDIDEDPNLSPEEREEVRVYMAKYVPIIVQVFHERYNEMKERSRVIFTLALDILHNMAMELRAKPLSIASLLFGFMKPNDNGVVKISSI